VGCAYIGIIGETEMKSGHITLKDLSSGDQEELSVEAVIQKLHPK